MRVCFLSCFILGGDEAGDADLTDSSFQFMISHLASCGLFTTFLTGKRILSHLHPFLEPHARCHRVSALRAVLAPASLLPHLFPSIGRAAGVCRQIQLQAQWEQPARPHCSWNRGTTRTRDPPRLNHDHVGLPAKAFQVSNSLPRSMPNTNPPKRYPQKPQRPPLICPCPET